MSDSLPDLVYSAAQVRELDRAAIETYGIPGYRLMERAAAAALAELRAAWPEARALAIYCGAGNNAGDGYVLARLAAAADFSVRVVAVVDPARLKGDAAAAHADCAAAGIAVEVPGSAPVPEPGDVDVIVDALLGTGLDRPLEGRLADAVAAINSGSRPVLAIDIPTGLDADSGATLGTPVAADLTVTVVGLKQGMFLGSAPNYLGTLKFSDLDVPPETAAAVTPVMRRLKAETLAAALPRRPRTAHKGANGRLLLIGSDAGFGGAIRLAAEAALRVGAGLVYVATHPDNVGVVMAGRPELICRGFAAGEAPDEWLEAVDAVVIGPGLGRGDFGRTLLERALARPQPLVVDADGLTLLAAAAPRARRDWIVTPHPGEAARLLGSSTAAVQAERLASVRALAARLEATAVLKGAGTLVADAPGGEVALCDRGNPGLATAGTGDVLAGVIGGLLVQGLAPPEAARTGVLLHALAGDAAAAQGERGLVASDLFPHLRRHANPA